MARWGYCYKEVAPFSALVIVQFTEVCVNILFKEATMKGLSYYVFILYSLALSTLILLLPLPFIFRRSTGLPSLNLSILCKIFFLGLLTFSALICGYKGIEYSSPSLASAESNLAPAFIFILAVLFRMEKAALRSSSTQAKILGSIVSIAGALIVVLYKGPTVLEAASQTPSLGSLQRNWVLGGFLLAVAYILVSIWYIVLTHVMKLYPAEMVVVLLCNLCGTIIAAPVCFLAEGNLSAWKLKPDITLVAVLYSAFFSTFFSTVVHTWGLHVKGPVYVSIFKPLSIAIAAAMSVIFLGEPLYLGSVVGAVILCTGFYAVIWGKAKEEEFSDQDFDIGGIDSTPPSNSNTPFLSNVKITYNDC
ncbi:EamA domain [Sesbania bispinosa]|nr:EamA domain [Sesbania bispinosa]